ncbi:hypothetical protein H2203_008282 [Taxawa tesnikishii (nom. ined.)]|nr:hypothetical protein H2203_008282 [Dothideales sp. JES 119]
MVNLHLAYTAPINPPNTTPVLNAAQCWAGLQHKVRHPQTYVKAIAECEIIEEEDGVVTRDVIFGERPNEKVREVCKNYEPTQRNVPGAQALKHGAFQVDFHQTNGSVISNIISDGPSGEPTDLYLTFAFQWVNKGVEAGSSEAEQLMKKYKAMAKTSVDKSIEAIRNEVKEGKI